MNAKGHVAGVAEYRYPALGEEKPAGGKRVQVLTEGRVCVPGTWRDDGSCLAWAPLPLEDKDKVARVQAIYAAQRKAKKEDRDGR